MAFTTDESVLNGINSDLINQYQQYVTALQPLLLQQSGYQKNVSDSNISPETNTALKKAQSDLDFYQKGFAGQLDPTTQGQQWNDFIQKTLGWMPKNSQQVDLAKQQLGQVLQNNLAVAQNKYDNEKVSFTQTPEAKALQGQFDSLQQAQLKQLQSQADYLNSDEYKAATAKQQQLTSTQQDQALAFAQRQKDALEGKIPTSDILTKQIQDSFNSFKDAQAKQGNIIMGDNPENAVGKGSAAIESLRAFQDNANASKQRELESIINQTPLGIGSGQAATGLYDQTGSISPLSQYTQQAFGQAYGTPQAAPYGSLSQLALGGQQPYQFQSQMALQQQQYQQQLQAAQQAQQRQFTNGLISGGFQLGGMALGSMFGGPAGAAVGSQAASGFYTPNPSIGYSPQFGNTYSPGSRQLG